MSYQDTFKALSDKTRREILTLLRDGPLSVGEIGAHFDISGATLSHHLTILRQADLISDSKKGKFIYYELNTTVLDDIIVWIKSLTEEA
ncbi:MAG: winged helix-turn-helix transcriptional regulator [Oscillospiraceae bacterium]|nr:winged helix-turn-helix transcriptional regulator [Oscillospiraceae bacterium]